MVIMNLPIKVATNVKINVKLVQIKRCIVIHVVIQQPSVYLVKIFMHNYPLMENVPALKVIMRQLILPAKFAIKHVKVVN
jgi:hypothetical protein